MAKQTEITGVPAVKLQISSENMKNLAGWIARYHSRGLTFENVGASLHQLLEKDELAMYEPSLKGVRANCLDEDLNPFEFTITIDDFVSKGFRYINLSFSFKEGYCMMYVHGHWPEAGYNSHLIGKFESISVTPLLLEDFSRDMSWQEADEIIRAYLELQNIPAPPK